MMVMVMVMNRLVKTAEEGDPWLFIRQLLEHGLFYLYSYDTEHASPYFRRAMQCRVRDDDDKHNDDDDCNDKHNDDDDCNA